MLSALTIAGSDPGGGAGIQCDLRVFWCLGIAGLSVISSITAQNSTVVSKVSPVDPATITAQLSNVLADTTPNAIKIGMLGGAEQVIAVCNALERHKNLKNVVLDPVLSSSSGSQLLDTAGRYLLLTSLIPLCDLVTPNLDEASALSGTLVSDRKSMLHAGELILSKGAKAVLVKGGHLSGQPTDWLLRRDYDPMEFESERVLGAHTHGTGCLLSSAIAAYLAKGDELTLAVLRAKALLVDSLKNPAVVGKGSGYPNPVLHGGRSIQEFGRTHAERIELLRGIYVVTDPQLQRGRSMEEVVLAALVGGAQVIQLRDKFSSTPRLVATARRLNKIVRDYGKLLIINDRVDVALAADADGVHLGPDDMDPKDVRQLLGPEKLIGISTGTVAEAMSAASYASYFGVGCIFGTRTKADAGEPIGPGRIAEIKKAVPGIPTVAIGGINASNIGTIISVGATSAAIVSAVVSSQDITAATKTLVRLFS
jgi:hydroxymethylpyrimidine kinase / phosphomethylpyrimidine kinase / thiamine-phosphate diphosphorylase